MLRRQKRARLARYEQIARVLARHGLGYLLVAFGLNRLVPLGKRHARRIPPHTQAEHVRLALEDLGPTFVKIGQILSTRADLLPPEMLAELARLQDSTRPVETAAVVRTIESELGRPLGELFEWFDETPLASASIGQVHAARLKGGRQVVVKVRRPHILELVERDLEVIETLAAYASRRWVQARGYDLVSIAEEFAQTLRAELDYVREARNVERFAANFAARPEVHIPKLYPELSTSRVLTLERIYGTKPNQLVDAQLPPGQSRSQLAARAAGVAVKMSLEDGFFHADPHPGNFFIEPDGRIGLVDFGMVGNVPPATRGELARGLVAVVQQDSERLVDVFIELGLVRGHLDRARLRADLQHLMTHYSQLPQSQVSVSQLVAELQGLIRQHRLQLPGDLAFLLKTLAMAEGVGRQIDPGFNLFEVLSPHAHRLMLRELSPALMARRVGQMASEATRLGVELPQQLHRLLSEAAVGGLQFGMRLEEVEPKLRRLEAAANRIAVAVVTAGVIVGLAVMIALHVPAEAVRWSVPVFILSLVAAALLGLWLTLGVLRTARHKAG